MKSSVPRTDRFDALESLEPRRHLSISIDLVGEGLQTIDRTTAMADGEFVNAGLYRKVQFRPNGKERIARDEADPYIARYRADGSLRWERRILGSHKTELRTRDDRIDFASNPLRAVDPFMLGVSTATYRPGEQITAITEAPNGDVLVAGMFLKTISFTTTTGERTLTSGDAEYYDSFILRFTADGLITSVSQIGGRFNEIVHDLKVDSAGNVIVAGYFERRSDFNLGAGTQFREPEGRGDGFIAKYSAALDAAPQWFIPIGSNTARLDEIEAVNSIALDAAGNVFASGVYAFSADFDPGTGRTVLRAVDRTDAYTARYNANGTLAWVKSQGGDDYDGGRTVSVSTDGSAVWSAGYFQREAILNPDQPSIIYKEVGRDGRLGQRSDLFFTRFNASTGAVGMVNTLGGEGFELIAGSAIDANGNFVLAGSYSTPTDFRVGRGKFVLSPPRADGINDFNERDRDYRYAAFVARYQPNARLVNAQQVQSAQLEDVFATGFSLDRNRQDAIVSGRTRGVIFNPAQGLPTTELPAPVRGREQGYLRTVPIDVLG
jgi:hypothetical protein